jgi:hypothetical protein
VAARLVAPATFSCCFASVVEWNDGMIDRMTNYTDIDEARAAAEHLANERG